MVGRTRRDERGTPDDGREAVVVTDGGVDIELLVADESEETPSVESGTRVDVVVNGRMYPTAKLADGRYVAWWFDTAAPDPESSVNTEWVAAPTRFLAAATIGELWDDPASLHALARSTQS
ncbi:hypothetical protein [Halomarina ordinaria]|uniref:Uncharacterized protein n=1 Tax=Halomarina ordinaria TaxID=3033939 RepID=A0ABD5UCR2_9EURY|nr:hypothetical protein [Halomarina sp. PSRA2]